MKIMCWLPNEGNAFVEVEEGKFVAFAPPFFEPEEAAFFSGLAQDFAPGPEDEFETLKDVQKFLEDHGEELARQRLIEAGIDPEDKDAVNRYYAPGFAFAARSWPLNDVKLIVLDGCDEMKSTDDTPGTLAFLKATLEKQGVEDDPGFCRLVQGLISHLETREVNEARE